MKENLLIINDLKKFVNQESILISEPLSNHTFTKTGGVGDIFLKPKNISEVEQIVRYASSNTIPLTVLGNGSNVIIRNKGIRGIIMSLVHLNDVKVDGTVIKAGSGAALIDVSRTALSHHLTGLEFACGIPGTIGGALVMNAGAYGGEISYVLKSAQVLTNSGELITLGEHDFQFGYRSSVFAKESYIILEATFQLEKSDHAKIKEEMDHFTMLRESKQPLEYPSCGSVFKRPPNQFAGKLIQDSDLQGTRIGGAEVSTKHAGFIVNVDQATSSDYIQLIRHIQETVKRKFDIELETEVKIIGEE
ncbi:UDP-N-acetylmuramate dehydrogenase [Metabacillus rhizolycopersici]|uniref:UDP-N-acetylenolpyruvoylglucosamine reductase n=1 Tax=Metabacillus rhizolycopersici TaxID=2875709 RepID=A0ABS7UMG4_9BACI|nr:UDP-N-acetylmuramate dehydrogenase [Metabacillus rhizolycopersici]MBZ5749496.1 UDP-N-acetylmuramate dehydrogenase [Metabacillus rhizolycopersici]